MKKYTIGLYEKAMPKTLNWRQMLECAKECGYDFVTYFRNAGKDNAAPPEKSLTRYDFRAVKKYEDWPSFAKETVWYGRRKGATLYSLT